MHVRQTVVGRGQGGGCTEERRGQTTSKLQKLGHSTEIEGSLGVISSTGSPWKAQ